MRTAATSTGASWRAWTWELFLADDIAKYFTIEEYVGLVCGEHQTLLVLFPGEYDR